MDLSGGYSFKESFKLAKLLFTQPEKSGRVRLCSIAASRGCWYGAAALAASNRIAVSWLGSRIMHAGST